MTLSNNIITDTVCIILLIDIQEKADMYKKMSFGTIQELHAKEELIKKLESMKRDQKSGMIIHTFNTKFYYVSTSEEEDVATFHVKEDTRESKDELVREYSEEAQKALEGQFTMIILENCSFYYLFCL